LLEKATKKGGGEGEKKWKKARALAARPILTDDDLKGVL